MVDTKSTRFRLTLDLGLFAVTLALAWIGGWTASDLLWSLWLSSLLVGWSLLLTATTIRPLVERARGGEAPPLLGTLAPVAFFTLHFGLFHFGHSIFLDSFFPLMGDEADLDGLSGFASLVRVAAVRYWPFVLISAVAMLPAFRTALESRSSKATFLPYRNVVRMHLMIFVIAGLNAADAPVLVLYATLVLYFFPYDAVRDAWKRRSAES